MRAGPVLRERRGLAPAYPPQFLDLADQLTDSGLQPLVLAGEPLDLAGELVALGPHRLALDLHHHKPLAQPAHRLALPASPPTLHRSHRGANHTPDRPDQRPAISIPWLMVRPAGVGWGDHAAPPGAGLAAVQVARV